MIDWGLKNLGLPLCDSSISEVPLSLGILHHNLCLLNRRLEIIREKKVNDIDAFECKVMICECKLDLIENVDPDSLALIEEIERDLLCCDVAHGRMHNHKQYFFPLLAKTPIYSC